MRLSATDEDRASSETTAAAFDTVGNLIHNHRQKVGLAGSYAYCW